MPDTEVYLQSIRQAKQELRRVAVDFTRLPKGVDRMAIFTALCDGLNAEEWDVAANTVRATQFLAIDYAHSSLANRAVLEISGRGLRRGA